MAPLRFVVGTTIQRGVPPTTARTTPRRACVPAGATPAVTMSTGTAILSVLEKIRAFRLLPDLRQFSRSRLKLSDRAPTPGL